MNSVSTKFVDEFLNVHHKGEHLGQGGQGVVFRTKDPDIAIKLVTDANGNPVSSPKVINWYSKKLKMIRLLPLPKKIQISVPVALLKDQAGYVMQLLSEMVPFSNFWPDGKSTEEIPASDIPKWLSQIPEEIAKKLVYYYQTGGLRRRLIALYKCSSILASLHGHGLVYGDISPNNIFISKNILRSEVWFIDADNLRFEVFSGGSGVYTPKYGAPELVQGKDGGRPATDCHAFAVLAFCMLSLVHPFIGQKVNGDVDWADEDEHLDFEEQAYAGFLPWIDDSKDDSNSTEDGLPRQLILTDNLKILFQRTFEDGKVYPQKRPTIFHWPEAFAKAADITIQCSCKMSWYYNFAGENCPYCNSFRPKMIILKSYLWRGKGQPLADPQWIFAREIYHNIAIKVPKRLLREFTMQDSDETAFEMIFSPPKILLKKNHQNDLELSIAIPNSQNENFQKISSQISITFNNENRNFWLCSHSNEPRLILCSIIGDNE